MARQPWDALVPHLLRAGSEPDHAIERLKGYMRALLEWNRTVSNLISGNDEQRFVERHLLESLQPAYWLRESGVPRWMDFGSGGGLPAIPLAVAGVGVEWTLVESRRMKTLFLRRVVDSLELKHVSIVNDRLENVVTGGEHAGRFRGFTSRATLTLAPTLDLAARLVDVDGDAFLWKGSGREAEMTAGGPWTSAWRLEGLLGVGAGVNVVCRFKRKS
ncbi:MAG: 16S rRNA (guanine(527)-N(7))-methyltransferase RsmG [Candidatus Eisenbacteria bacterium]